MMESAADWKWTGYSLDERDRRWNAVRANAAKAELDCTFVPLCLDGASFHLSLEQVRGARSDGRYLTQMEGASVVLPTDGRPPIVITDRGAPNAWIPEARPAVRGGHGSWVDAMVQALQDAGMERARIGVIGLTMGSVTHGRASSGVVNYSSYAAVVRALPNATFVDSTDVVGYARYVKGEEEIECLRHGAQIATAGIEVMIDHARPGVAEAELYARVMGRMLSLGSEYYGLAWNVGPLGAPTYRHQDAHLGRTLRENWVINNEVSAVVGNQVAQEPQPVLLGSLPDEYRAVTELQLEVFQAGLEYMTPGREMGDLIDFINGFGAKRGMRTGALFHGRGYGDDGPVVTPQQTGELIRSVRLLRPSFS